MADGVKGRERVGRHPIAGPEGAALAAQARWHPRTGTAEESATILPPCRSRQMTRLPGSRSSPRRPKPRMAPFPAPSGPVSSPPEPPGARGDHGPDHPWEACLGPFLAFTATGLLEPGPSGGGLAGMAGIPFSAYPLVYALRIVATLGIIVWQWPAIRRWLGRPSWWPPLLGILLVIPWVALAALQRDAGWAGWLGGSGERAAFDPFATWGDGGTTRAYLLLRGLGLVAVIPLIEELFLRGFLMRYVVDESFWKVPFGLLSPAAAAACAVYAVVSHPAEALAAIAWFGVVTGIAAATRRPIDCILAHAGTNLALGAWVLTTRDWWLV